MGHGAPKRDDAIPMSSIVQIYSWEGLLFDETQKLAETLKAILDGDETLWGMLDERRKRVVFYNQQYTKAILSLQISQNRA
jgi:hypothetical protein